MSGDAHWHRRQALQIASQLLENYEDAMRVLEHAKALIAYTTGRGETVTVPISRPHLKPVS
jgi:hypothetical protein